MIKNSITVAICLCLACTVFAYSEQAVSAANNLASKGYIVDNSGNIKKYNLDTPILRQESIGIITKVNGLVQSGDLGYKCQNKFSDVSSKDGWVCYVVETAAENNVVNGANKTFRPKSNMTHFEAMILAFKGSCIQPIDNSDSQSPQEQVLGLALDAGLTDNGSIDLNQLVTRGEFFIYITQAQSYKNENPDLLDGSLPGCISYKNVSIDKLLVKLPESAQKEEEETEDEWVDSYIFPDFSARVTLGKYSSEGKTSTSSYAEYIAAIRAKNSNGYELLSKYNWKGGKMYIYTWQEDGKDDRTKVYDFSKVSSGDAYSVEIAISLSEDLDNQKNIETVLNSILIEGEVSKTDSKKNNPIAGDTVNVNYKGYFENGEVFDKGGPLTFTIGKDEMIVGFEKAIKTMKRGEKKTVRILPKEAYGEEFVEETVPLSEFVDVNTVTVSKDVLKGKSEQTLSRSDAEGIFDSIIVGATKKIGEATLKIVSVTGNDIVIFTDDPSVVFYGKEVKVGDTVMDKNGNTFKILSFFGEEVEVEIKISYTVIKKTDTEITYKYKNPHHLAGKVLNFDIELINF